MNRTLMALILGGWLLGTVLVAAMAAGNFWMIDSLLESPSHSAFRQNVRELPAGEARVMLRYLASELNRSWFFYWGWLEACFAVALLALAARLRRRNLLVGFGLMLVVVAVMNLYLTPRIIEVGRALDFVPRQPPPPNLAEFGRLHAAYTILDLAKLAVGVWTAIALACLPAISSERQKKEAVP